MSIIGLNFSPGDSPLASALIAVMTRADPSGKAAEAMKAAIKAATIRAIGRVSSDFRKELKTAAAGNALGWPQKSAIGDLIRANPPSPRSKGESTKGIRGPLKPTRLLGKLIPAIRYSLDTEYMISTVGLLGPGDFDAESIRRMRASDSLPSSNVGRIGYWFQRGGQFHGHVKQQGQQMEPQTRKYFGALGIFDPARRKIGPKTSSAAPFQRPQRQLVAPLLDRANLPSRLEQAFIERLMRMTANG